ILCCCLLGFSVSLSGQASRDLSAESCTRANHSFKPAKDINQRTRVQQSDSTVFTIQRCKFKQRTQAVPQKPFYKHTLIFGDGNFRFTNSEEKGVFKHLYGSTNSNGIESYRARVYSSGIYGTLGDPPTKLEAPPIDTSSLDIAMTQTVDNDRYIKILRNVQVKPGDPFITVLSLRNPTETSLNGNLFFLYDGKMRITAGKEEKASSSFSQFAIEDNLFYRGDIFGGTTSYFYSTSGQLKEVFKKVMLVSVAEFPPGEEVHFFVETIGDTIMMKDFKGTEQAKLDFALALSVDNGSDAPNYMTADDSAAFAKTQLQSFANTLSPFSDAVQIQPDSTKVFSIQGDSSSITGNGSPYIGTDQRFVDYTTSTARLVKVHDPNFMLLESCACQGKEERYLINATVQCENSGYATTSNVYIDIKLPAGITKDDIFATPLSYHPYNSPSDMISMIELTNDSIRWELENFGLEGTPIHGVDDPRTFANVQFQLFSSVPPDELAPIQACIRFDKLSSDPVCTTPTTVNLRTENGEFLNCEAYECENIPTSEDGWPIWIWIVIIFLIILAIILLFRK
ncbi:MAG: hypothetical protein AAGJ82_03930, partial [Bacteroidota bacterium]